MKQNPSRLKFRKNHKVSFSFFKLVDKKTFYPMQGNFALQAQEAAHLTLKQIEAGRKAIRRSIKKTGMVSIRVFTGRSVTAKSPGSRMGKGKGSHSYWMSPVQKGQVIYELSGVSWRTSFKALSRASVKLPFRSRIVRLLF